MTDDVQREIDRLQSEKYFLLAYYSELGGQKAVLGAKGAYTKGPGAFLELFKAMEQVLIKEGVKQLSFF